MMGLETLLFVVLFIVVVGIAVIVMKARRRLANRMKPPMEERPQPPAGRPR